jgi:hypothetical protein
MDAITYGNVGSPMGKALLAGRDLPSSRANQPQQARLAFDVIFDVSGHPVSGGWLNPES